MDHPWAAGLRKSYYLALLLLAVALVLASPPQSFGFVSLSGAGSPGGELKGRTDIAMAPSGQIYMSEHAADDRNFPSDGGRVLQFSPTGTFTREWGGFGSGSPGVPAPDGKFHSARGIAINSYGEVLVADSGNDRIQQFTADGTFIRAFGSPGMGGPNGLAIDSDDHVFTALTSAPALGEDPVAEFDRSGNLLSGWGSSGQFAYPSGIAVSGNEVYVTDSLDDRVRVFDRDGNLLRSWSSGGGENSAVDIAATNDAVYVVGPASTYVRRFTPNGTEVASVSASTLGLNSLNGVAARGNQVLVAGGEGRVVGVGEVFPKLAISDPVAQTGGEVTFQAGASESLTPDLKYEWDLDGDGSFERNTQGTDTVSKVFQEPFDGVVRVRVTSAPGVSAVAARPLEVRQSSAPGPVGVSVDDGAQFTNDPRVSVAVRWPDLASEMWISNDGGFSQAKLLPVEDHVDWKLDSSGPERLPKTIYVRFQGGESGPETYQDDIILDETNPVVESASIADAGASTAGAVAAKSEKVKLRIKAKDKTSGVKRVQITNNKKKPGEWTKFKTKASFKSRGKKIYVRVQDGAKNRSGWERAKP